MPVYYAKIIWKTIATRLVLLGRIQLEITGIFIPAIDLINI
jgi:hypothetical protein